MSCDQTGSEPGGWQGLDQCVLCPLPRPWRVNAPPRRFNQKLLIMLHRVGQTLNGDRTIKPINRSALAAMIPAGLVAS